MKRLLVWIFLLVKDFLPTEKKKAFYFYIESLNSKEKSR
jgi:hypothetical protein